MEFSEQEAEVEEAVPLERFRVARLLQVERKRVEFAQVLSREHLRRNAAVGVFNAQVGALTQHDRASHAVRLQEQVREVGVHVAAVRDVREQVLFGSFRELAALYESRVDRSDC